MPETSSPQNTSPQNTAIRLAISEAARLFGVNPQTIRRAIKAQEVIYVVVRGRYKISLESLIRWSQKRTSTKNKLERRGLGQFVAQWKIKNTLFSPNPANLKSNQPKDTNPPTA